jgi:hypothetical protein
MAEKIITHRVADRPGVLDPVFASTPALIVARPPGLLEIRYVLLPGFG